MLLLAFAEFDLPSKSHHSERVCVCMCALVIEFERPVKAEGREKSIEPSRLTAPLHGTVRKKE